VETHHGSAEARITPPAVSLTHDVRSSLPHCEQCPDVRRPTQLCPNGTVWGCLSHGLLSAGRQIPVATIWVRQAPHTAAQINCLTNTCSLFWFPVNPLNAELNPICYLVALLGAHHFLHVSRIRVNDQAVCIEQQAFYWLINLSSLHIQRRHFSIQRHAVEQLVEALRYKSECRGFDSRWCHRNFSLT
jgi:hypothetical protein